jgi:glycosidase
LNADYKDVDSTFGTMEDFDTMAAEAKKRNLR